MLVAFVAGTFTVVTLALNALVAAGGRASRQRRTIAADLALWQDLPAEFEGRDQLRRHIEAQLASYGPAARPDAVSLDRRARRATLTLAFDVIPTAVAVALIGAVVASGINNLNAPAWAVFGLSAVWGIAVAAVLLMVWRRGLSASRRRREARRAAARLRRTPLGGTATP